MRNRKRSSMHPQLFIAGTPIVLLMVLLFLTACPTQIDNAMVRQKRDEGAPSITILSPVEGDYYTELVTVTGTVSDDSAGPGEIGEIRSLSYEVIGPLGTIESSDLSFDTDGSFSFQFATANIDGSAVVKIKATDWNDNLGEYSITLKDPGNDIPSFTVKPDNQEVHLSWDSVPNAVGYTIHYTTNGTPPSVSYGKKVQNITQAYPESSPLVIDELKNGNMHVFLLQAHSSNPNDLWLSDNEKAIPLSSLTLVPRVTGEFGRIRIEWDSIPATDQFEVLRSTERDGDYINVSGIVDTTSLTDDTVTDGQVYFYKVKPSFSGSIESDANCDETSPFTFAEGIQLVAVGPGTGPGLSITVDGNNAYVGYYSSMVQRFDITDPLNPVLIATNFVSAPVYDLKVNAGYLYVATLSGLWTLNTSDLSQAGPPVLSGLTCYGLEIDAADSRMYVATGTVGVFKLNITNPTFPVTEGQVPLGGGRAYDIALDGGYVYAADFQSPFIWRLVKNPFSLDINAPLSFPNTDISIDGNYIALTGPYGFAVVDLASLTQLGVFSSGNFYGTGVWLDGIKAYVANRFNQLQVISLFDPTAPFMTAFTDLPGLAQGVALSGSYAYVADYYTSLDVVDISTSTPDNPSITDTYAAGDARAIEVAGDFAYVANGASGIQVIDITDPDTLAGAGSQSLSGIAVDVTISGNYAFMAMEDDPATSTVDEGGLQILDLTSLGLVGSLITPGNAVSVAVKGDYAYVADDTGGLQIIDVSFPDDPKRVGFRETSGDTNGVAVQGNYAFVTDGSGGFHAVDVSIPQNPRIAQTIGPSDDYNDVVLSGGFAFAAKSSGSIIEVIDISFPNNLSVMGFLVIPGTPLSVTVSGNYAFVADGSGGGSEGFEVIDITDPANLIRIGSLDMSPGSAVDVDVSGDHALVVDGSDGSIKSVDLLPTN